VKALAIVILAILVVALVSFAVVWLQQMRAKSAWRPFVTTRQDGQVEIGIARGESERAVLHQLPPGSDPIDMRLYLDEAREQAEAMNRSGRS
jgi:cell division protein YceG involved in septum cleavage